jgi:8-oxo-dGTP pyrophosphatase MutT (NUDIX family)
MIQGYKVFFDDRVVFLTSKITKSFEKNDGLFYKFREKDELLEILKAFENYPKIKMLFILYDDVDALLEMVKACYTIVEAAGGVVRRPDGKMLAIYRRGKWDLPKGKVEKGEFYKQTALREVKEECGLQNIEAGKKFADTYHVYSEKGRSIFKRTVWYEMQLLTEEQPVVQESEDITDYLWFDYLTVKDIMKNTYESLKEIYLIQINPTNQPQ